MLPLKRKLKRRYYIKINFKQDETTYRKLKTIFNQLNIENSGALDEFFPEYFTNLGQSDFHVTLPISNVTLVLDFIIWRRALVNNYYRFKILDSESVLKFFIVNSRKICFPFTYSKTADFIKEFTKVKSFYWYCLNAYYFALSFCTSSYNESDLGLYWDYVNFYNFSSSLPGQLGSYINRDKELGKKINYRDKSKRKKIEIT